MASEPRQGSRDITPLLWAVTVAVGVFVATMLFLDWGLISAAIGGASMGVVWWYVNRSFYGGGSSTGS